jgi:hypothetical protein
MLCGPSRARQDATDAERTDFSCLRYELLQNNRCCLEKLAIFEAVDAARTRTTFASLSTMPTRAQNVEMVIYEDASKDML